MSPQSAGDSLVLLRRHRPRERKHKAKPRSFRRMAMRAIEHRSAAQNQLDRRPRVFASRDRVHVKGDKPALPVRRRFYGGRPLRCRRQNRRRPSHYRALPSAYGSTLAGSPASGHTAELINELRPEHFFSFPACRTPRATRRNRYQAVVLKSRH